MDSLSKEYLVSFYGRKLSLHGDRPESLGWTLAGQQKQYSLLLKTAGDLTGLKVLDYGCGKGDLYGFLLDKDIKCDYTGFDINPSVIELANRKYSNAGGDVSFRVFDAEDDELEEDFDYAFLCGVFNNKIEGVNESLINILSRLFPRINKALFFTGLSDGCRDKDFELNYINTASLAGYFIEHLTHDLSLIYRKDFFAMGLYKKDWSI